MPLFVTLFSLVLNIIYYVVCQKLRIKNFTKYFVGFVAYSLILFFIIFLLELEFILMDFLSFLIIYLLFFISLFLTMPLKYIKSPTYLIIKSLKNKNTRNKIIKYLEDRKALQIRIKDLESQNIIEVKKNTIILKKNLGFVINIIFFIKKFFNLKSEG